jgi:DNA-binding transcriptional regulator LsrR (DeoR family)
MKQAPRFGERCRPAESVGISWGAAVRALMAASQFTVSSECPPVTATGQGLPACREPLLACGA